MKLRNAWSVVACLMGIAVNVRAQESYPFCQLLDRLDQPAWQAHAGYVAESDVDQVKGHEFGIVELSGGGGLAYYRTEIGDFDIGGGYDFLFFTADGGSLNLPDKVGALHLNSTYIWRNQDARAVKVDLYPGIYSEFSEFNSEAIYVPFSISGIQAFNPQVSGLIGLAVFPGFEDEYDPRIGVRIAPSDEILVDLMYPESRITYTPAIDWDVYAGAKIDNVSQYRLKEDDPRDSIMYDQTRLYVGVNTPFSDTLRVMYQAGLVCNRSIDYKNRQGKADVDDALFLSVGLGGTL